MRWRPGLPRFAIYESRNGRSGKAARLLYTKSSFIPDGQGETLLLQSCEGEYYRRRYAEEADGLEKVRHGFRSFILDE